MTGSIGYSSSDNTVPNFDEILNGLVTRTATRESTTGGPADTSRVSVNADWSGVYAVTDKFRIEDFYRYDNWRIPGMWATFETNLFGAADPDSSAWRSHYRYSTRYRPQRPGCSQRCAPWRPTTR